MIDEIKRKLKDGRVFLKCIDKDEFISKDEVNREILNLEEIEVKYYQEEDTEYFDGFQLVADEDFLEDRGLNINDMFIRIDEIAYFEIVKNKPTFDDLIDVAVQAYRDGYIKKIRLEDDVLDVSFNVDEDGLCGFLTSKTKENSYHFQQYIQDIKSLYTETFVIEREEDISKVKSGAEVVLANGSRGIAESQHCHLGESFLHVVSGDYSTYLYLFSLKGATVTQRKANN